VAERDAFGNEIGPSDEPPPREVGQRRSATFLTVLVVALIVAGVAVAVIVGLGGKDQPASESAAAEATTAPPTSPAQPAAAPPKPASLLRPRALSVAIDRLRGRGQLRLLRVAPDRVDAQLVTTSGALRNVQITATGQLRDLGTGGAATGGLATIPYAHVDARAPARMLRVASARAGRPPARVDYLVLLMLPTGQSWNLYFKPDGLHFAGDLHGQHVVRR
jgi:hypothetical protein